MVDINIDTANPSDSDSGDGSGAAQDFETALAQLENLVERMESGNLSLDESLKVYERGVQLARVCQQRLDQAEEQVKVLQGNLLRPLDDPSKDES